MDIIDKVIYDFPEHLEQNPEATRRAFIKIFNPNDDDAMLVMKYLVGVTMYGGTITSSDATFNSQLVAMNGIMSGIKEQLNKKPVEMEKYTDE
jgi:hypothetical protein